MPDLLDVIDDELSEHTWSTRRGCECGAPLPFGNSGKHRHGNLVQAARAHLAERIAIRLRDEGLLR